MPFQARPLAAVRAQLALVYHEYFSEAQGWLDYIDGIGWDALHNWHIVIERDGDRLIIAGVDDATALASGVDGHGANLEAALADSDPALPALLLAHQPNHVVIAVTALIGNAHRLSVMPCKSTVSPSWTPTIIGVSATVLTSYCCSQLQLKE